MSYSADYARELERENQNLRQQLDDARAQLAVEKQHCEALGKRVTREARRAVAAEARAEQAEATIAAAKAIEDELFTALLAACQSAWPDMMPTLVGEARRLSVELHAALAAAGPSAPETPSEVLPEPNFNSPLFRKALNLDTPASSDEPARCEHGSREGLLAEMQRASDEYDELPVSQRPIITTRKKQ